MKARPERPTISVTCKGCGQPHSYQPIRGRKRKFCNPTCSYRFKSRTRDNGKPLGAFEPTDAAATLHIGGAWHSLHPEGRIQWNTKALAVGFADLCNADETTETEQVKATFSDWRGEGRNVMAQWADTGHWECVGVADFEVCRLSAFGGGELLVTTPGRSRRKRSCDRANRT